MKKIASLLAIILVLGAFCACDGGNSTDSVNFADFSAGGVKVTLDDEAQPILSALGEYRAFAETGSCFGDGKDRVYEYTSFKVQTYSQGTTEYILAVEIFSDADASVATGEGIRIGSGRDAVIAVYGEALGASDTKLTYLRADGAVRLQFLLRDGAVSNIQYLKADA